MHAKPKQAVDPIDQLRNHSHVDRVVPYDDDTLNGFMVIADWVTDSTMENGTRIIHDKEYDGHIRKISRFIDSLPGVETRRAGQSGLARYTFHVKYTGDL